MAMMQLILRADVDNIGHLGEIVSVKPGFGRNYLIPQGLAMLATDANKRAFENERKKLQAKMDAVKAEAQRLGDKINNAVVEIQVRVGEGDRLYGSVTTADIAKALAKVIGEEVDRRLVTIESAIKALGIYPVTFKLHPDVTAECVLKVYRQGGSAADLEPAAPAEPEAPAAEDAATVQSEDASA